MNFCSKCGAQNSSDSIYCSKCGMLLQATEQHPPRQPQQPPEHSYGMHYAPPYQRTNMADMRLSDNDTVNIIKHIGASPLFLALAIVYSAAVFFNLISSFSVFSVFPMVIPGLTLGGLWAIYVDSRKPGIVGTTGFMLIKAALIITLVILCILVGVVLIAGVVGAIVAKNAAVAIAIVLVLAVLVAPPMIYYILYIKSINNVKLSALSGTPVGKFSMFVVVWNFFRAFFTFVSIFLVAALANALQNFVRIMEQRYNDLPFEFDMANMLDGGISAISIISTLVSVAAIILSSIVMMQYNKKLYSYNTPGMNQYTSNPYAAASYSDASQPQQPPMQYNNTDGYNDYQQPQQPQQPIDNGMHNPSQDSDNNGGAGMLGD